MASSLMKYFSEPDNLNKKQIESILQNNFAKRTEEFAKLIVVEILCSFYFTNSAYKMEKYFLYYLDNINKYSWAVGY